MANDLITRLILDSKQFDGNLQRSQKEMKNFQKEISAKVGDVSKAFSSTIGVVGKLAPAIGIAAGGVETFKKAIFSTQATQDAFNRSIEQAKGATDTFFQLIARADFSNFKTEMENAIKLAGNYYDALDKLQTRLVHSSVELLEVEVDQQKIKEEIEKAKLAFESANNAQEKKIAQEQLRSLEGQLTENAKKRVEIQKDLAADYKETFSEGLKKEFRLQQVNEDNVLELIRTSNKKKLAENTNYWSKLVKESNQLIVKSMNGQWVEDEERKKQRDAARHKMEILKGSPAHISYLISESPDDLESILKWYKERLIRLKDISRAGEDLAKQKLSLFNTSNKTTGTKSKTVKEQKELYKSYDSLVGKVEEYRVSMAKASEAGDTAGIVYWQSEMEKAQAKIDELKKYERNQAKGTLPTSTFFADSIATKRPDAATLNKGLQEDVIKMNKKVADSELEKAKVAVEAANMQQAATYGLIDSLGSMIEMNDLSAASFIRMVSKMLPQIASLVAAENMKTIAGTTSSGGAAGGIPGAIGGLAVGLGLVASILSATVKPKFAGGGIVGDKNLVRINSGEMILNHAQQNRLFNSINSGKMESGTGGEVQFKIQGQDLIGVIGNYNSKFKKNK